MRGGIESGCLSINNSGELIIPKPFLTAPSGQASSLPTILTVEYYEDEDCKGNTNPVRMNRLFYLNDDERYQSEITTDYYKVSYAVDLFDQSEEVPEKTPEENSKLVKGQACSSNDECESSICGEVYSDGYEKAGGTPEYDKTKFEMQCLAFNAQSECTEDSDCQSGKCIINTRGLGKCSKVSVIDEQPFCKSHTDCLSGYCYQWNEDNPRGGVCLAIPSTTNYFSFNATDEITLDLATDSSISGTDDFSVSFWFKVSYPAPEDPMLLVTQRDSNYYSGIYSIGINGASPGFTGYIPSREL